VLARLSLVLGAALISSAASAFDNIEADALYTREVRKMIQEEYATVLDGLEKQAKALGMEVRKKDVDELKQHMYEKAFVMTKCYDMGITRRKMVDSKFDVVKFGKQCVEVHFALMRELKISRNYPTIAESCYTSWIDWRESPPYDFLEPLSATGPTDYIKLKKCMETPPDPLFGSQRRRY